MNTARAGQVALLIDCENLVYGLTDDRGELTEELDPNLIFGLAEEYGQVVLANAYADRRHKAVNQYQLDLYRLGVDLVYVFGRVRGTHHKNAVDVKMAVDAVEILWTLPNVQAFVLVSGDRDFVHLLKTLRRYGRTIVGVAPGESISDDLASLCDRFVRYRALAHAVGIGGEVEPMPASAGAGLDQLKQAISELLTARPAGLKGAQIKPLLRRTLSPSFDESDYGYSRLSDLLLDLTDSVRVQLDSGGSDFTVLPVEGDTGDAEVFSPSMVQRLITTAGLKTYKFRSDPEVRRSILSALFDAIPVRRPFTLSDVFEHVLHEQDSLPVSMTILSKCHPRLWQSRLFTVESGQSDVPTRDRLMRLDPSVTSADDLIFPYEAGIAFKLAKAAEELNSELSPEVLAEILGFEPAANYAYCERLLEFNASMRP